METNDKLPTPVREFVDRIAGTPFLRPQEPEEWMEVEHFDSWRAAWRAARDAANVAAWRAGGNVAWRKASNAAYRTGRSTAYHAAWVAARDAAREPASRAACDVTRYATRDAADYAAALVVADLVDITWPHRWWRAWELGYIPIREDGDKLVVAAKRRAARRMRQNEDDR